MNVINFVINEIKSMSFELKGALIACILLTTIAYGWGYQIGFKRGFDGDPIFKHKED